jgi:hypothetical protein
LELQRWHTVSPVTNLTAEGFYFDCVKDWPEGPHLNGVRRLTLRHHDPLCRPIGFDSPNLCNLEDLTLRPRTGEHDARYVNVPALILRAPWGSQLRALDVQLQSEEEGAFLLDSDLLSQLDTLRIDLPWLNEDDDDFDQRRWLGELAQSPRLAGLQRLQIAAKVSPREMGPLVQHPVWTNLRYLDLDFPTVQRFALAADNLPKLEELRLSGLQLTPGSVSDLVSSPLLKRLRHLCIRGGYQDGRALLPLVDVVDPERIETFALGVPYFPERAANALRAKLGDRVRFLPT